MTVSPMSTRPQSVPLHARRGERLALPQGSIWTLERGELVVTLSGRPVAVWRAPCTLVGGRAAFTALEAVVLSPVAASDAARLEALMDQGERLWDLVDGDARRDDDTFLDGALPVPGPWHFRSVQARLLVMEGPSPRPPKGLRRLGRRKLVIVARFRDCGSSDPRDGARFGYHEVTPFVPVWSRRGPELWVPELYCDAWMAMVLGREIHGFPKRTARVGFHDQGAELMVDRRVALRLRFDGTRGGNASELMGEVAGAMVGPSAKRPVASLVRRLQRHLRLPVVVHKRIGDPRTSGSTLAVDELVRVPIRLDPISSASCLTGLRVDGPSVALLSGKVLGGWEIQTGFRFGSGRVVGRGVSR